MTKRGVDFLRDWIAKNVTASLIQSVDYNAASLAVEMAERLTSEAARAGFLLDDLQPEFGTPEELIREALDKKKGRRHARF